MKCFLIMYVRSHYQLNFVDVWQNRVSLTTSSDHNVEKSKAIILSDTDDTDDDYNSLADTWHSPSSGRQHDISTSGKKKSSVVEHPGSDSDQQGKPVFFTSTLAFRSPTNSKSPVSLATTPQHSSASSVRTTGINALLYGFCQATADAGLVHYIAERILSRDVYIVTIVKFSKKSIRLVGIWLFSTTGHILRIF